MKIYSHVLFAILLAFLSVLSYAQAPVPFVNQPLVPDAIAPGGPQFTLTVNGTGFVANSVVNWNGNALATQFVGGSQLTATVPAADIAKASTASVTVVNPAPGGGTSNVAFFTVAYNTGGWIAFAPGSAPAVGPADGVVAGDFNGDGKLDLAVASYESGTVSILLGDGTGNFIPGSAFPGGYAIVEGDFNRDGKLDLAVGVSLLLGDGTGNFKLASYFPGSGNAIGVGDFNGDGKLDLVTTDVFNDIVYILLGDGTGKFTLASSPGVGDSPHAVAVGDFNGDGRLDLAVANTLSYTVSILLGDGTGKFTLASSPGVGAYPYAVAVGDLNGDGRMDLAVVNGNSSTVSILLGDGTGNFTLASSPGVGAYPYAVAVGDFNGDGKLDLAVGANYADAISILLGDGAGNFTLASSPTAFAPSSVAVGDFNGDGKLDLAASNSRGNTTSILLGVPPTPAVSLSPTSLTFGPQLFGSSSAPQPVTLTNIGSAPLAITKGTINANFSQTNNCPRQLPPGGQCTANVVFTPRNVNTITGNLTVTDNAPNSPQTVSLTGVGTAVSLLPSSLNFGSQQVGTTSQPQTVTLTNYASKAVTISGGDFAGRNPASFKLQNTTCQHSLPAGGSCTINIAFAPKRTGAITATFEVNDNGGASPQTVTLSGTGTQ